MPLYSHRLPRSLQSSLENNYVLKSVRIGPSTHTLQPIRILLNVLNTEVYTIRSGYYYWIRFACELIRGSESSTLKYSERIHRRSIPSFNRAAHSNPSRQSEPPVCSPAGRVCVFHPSSPKSDFAETLQSQPKCRSLNRLKSECASGLA